MTQSSAQSPSRRLVVSAIQLTSSNNLVQNLERASALIERSATRGAKLIVLPENFAFMGPNERDKLVHAETLSSAPGHSPGPIQRTLQELSSRLGVTIIAGGLPERTEDPNKVHNTCAVFGDKGELVASYRKIHLFDVSLQDGTEYMESRSVTPGTAPVLYSHAWAPIGLSVCYDLRFPELYRALVAQGARALVVPAAFTLHTGKDHWHVLLRARAIENQCYVIAPGQFGRNVPDKQTYGHSLIVDPWGTVIAEASDGEGYALAELDLDVVDRVRAAVPCLKHRQIGV